MDKLVHQAGFPDPSLSDHGDEVAVACRGPRQGLLQRLELHLTPDKAGESAHRGGMEAPPERTGPDQLEHLHRLCQPRTGTGPRA